MWGARQGEVLTPLPLPAHVPSSQVHSGNLQAVLDMVVSHQGLALKADLALRLMTALVLPDPAHYRPLLRRMAVLRTKGSEQTAIRAHNLLVRTRRSSPLKSFHAIDGLSVTPCTFSPPYAPLLMCPPLAVRSKACLQTCGSLWPAPCRASICSTETRT